MSARPMQPSNRPTAAFVEMAGAMAAAAGADALPDTFPTRDGR